MNQNQIVTTGFSNPASARLYQLDWPSEPAIFAQKMAGLQCGACAFYAPLNSDYGVCCNPESRHRTETVFEHFSCPSMVDEGWSSHSFSKYAGGRPSREFRDGIHPHRIASAWQGAGLEIQVAIRGFSTAAEATALADCITGLVVRQGSLRITRTMNGYTVLGEHQIRARVTVDGSERTVEEVVRRIGEGGSMTMVSLSVDPDVPEVG